MIDLHNMDVLIVDDMVSMCKSIHKMMKVIEFGRAFHYAHNGREALKVLKREQIDLVMMDYNMPVMNGAELLANIRDDRELRHLPVVMITAQAYTEYVAEAAESDIDAYILKPLTIRVLEEKVVDVINKANNPAPMFKHLQRAKQLEDEGDIDGALKEAQLAMKADPQSSRPIRELGYYYYKTNNLKQAEKWLLKAASMNYLDVFAFHNLGELYTQVGNYEKAQKYFEKAMSISPRHLDRGIKFGKSLLQMKMFQRAAQAFESVIQFGEDPMELREEIAEYCMAAESFAYAAQLWETLLSHDPERQDIRVKMGLAYKGAGNINEALIHLEEAAKMDKQNSEIKLYLAQCYLEVEKPIKAERALKQILKDEPDNAEALELLKRCIEMDAFRW